MKKLVHVLVLTAAFAALGLGLVAAQDQDRTGWPETFIIGVYPGDNVEEALAAVEPLRAYLEETLGIRTVLITGTSYNAVIEAMAAGRADAMEVGPFSYVLAADVAKAEALAVVNYQNDVTLENVAEAIDLTEVPGYYGVMFTKKGSGIESIADLKGRSFAFTDPASTSGYLVPANDIMIAMEFTDPAQIEEFTNVTFAGNHPSAVLAVVNGSVDAGATFEQNIPAQIREAGIEVCGWEDGEWDVYRSPEEIKAVYDACPEGKIVIFHQSPLIPETPFAVRSDYPQSFKDAVRDALLAVAENPELVVALQRYYVDPTEALNLESLDALYNPLRDIARNLNINLRAR